MRYRKGSIALNDSRDIPALRLVRDSRAISLSQATKELNLLGVEVEKRSTSWRFRRLVQSGLLETLKHEQSLGEPIFSITHAGLEFLESRGYAMLALSSSSKTVIRTTQVHHMLELNAIRLALREASVLAHWKSELQIISENLVNYGNALKDYDALVTVSHQGRQARFALEYERTAKGSARYKEISKTIAEDDSVTLVLYLAANQELLFLLAQEFRPISDKVVIGLASSFRTQLLETPVLFCSDSGSEFRRFSTILSETPDVFSAETELLSLSL